MSTSREKLLIQFRELVTERLAKVSRDLMALEAGPDADVTRQVLRELHSLKGESRMMGFADVNALVHEMEELIRAVQQVGQGLSGASVDALLVASDSVAVLAGTAQGEAPDVAKLKEWLAQATAGERARGGGAEADPQAPISGAYEITTGTHARLSTSGGQGEGDGTDPARTTQGRNAPVGDASIRISQQSLETLTSGVTNLNQRTRRRELMAQRRRQLARELVLLHRAAEDLGPLAQELASRLGKAKELASDLNRLSTLLATEEIRDLTTLSEEIHALRMVSLTVLFEPYPRMVRDLARDLGKDVELRLDGADERIDRTVLEALREPLLHLVRNAVDHGIEDGAERSRTGKPQRALILLGAHREGERIVIKVQDDGRGLDASQLRASAVRKGLLDVASAESMSDAAALDLIFLSGYSSKDTVTDVSGRGVGLDVVRTRLMAIGGEVTVQTVAGSGSAFELRVPLSLAVAPVLFIQVGDEQLCLPASNVVCALQVEEEQVRQVGGRPALRVQEEVVPFASIASILGQAPERAAAAGELVLVLRGRGQQAAIAVDRVLEERVQAIFPLKGLLSRYNHLSGATALADGTLALVLAAPHLVATAHGREGRLMSLPVARPEVRRSRVLVVDDSPLTRELLVQALESVGYIISQASDGAEALALLGKESVDLVVTDLEMPNVDGLELTRRLKSHATLRSVPVVIVTTRGSDADRRRGMEAGADGYVAKGDLVRQDLVDVIARLLA